MSSFRFSTILLHGSFAIWLLIQGFLHLAESIVEKDRYRGCGGIFTNFNGVFTSPGYPNSYPDNVLCSYVIKVDSKSKIKIDIVDLDLEESADCKFDSLTIRDGYRDDSPILKKICGRQTVETIVSTQSTVLVQFVTDQGVSKRGFKAEWSQVPRITMLPLRASNLPSPWTLLQTPKGVQQMDSGIIHSLWVVTKDNEVLVYTDEGWNIVDRKMSYVTAGDSGVWGIDPDGKVYYREGVTDSDVKGTQWKLAPGGDNIKFSKIESGIKGTLVGISNKGELLLRLGITDNNRIGTSWGYMTIPSELGTRVKDISCGTYGCFLITLLGGVYFGKETLSTTPGETKWSKIDGLYASQVTHGFGSSIWATSLTGNVVKISGMTTLDQRSPSVEEVEGIRFLAITNGIKGTYGLTDDGYIAYNKDVVCGNLLTEKTGVITSPNYPYYYPKSATCLWIIRVAGAKRIVFLPQEPFEVGRKPSCLDWVATFKDGKYPSKYEAVKDCGDARPTLKSVPGNEFWIEFNSTGEWLGKGFQAVYEAGFTDVVPTTKPTPSTVKSTVTTQPTKPTLPEGWRSIELLSPMSSLDTGHTNKVWGFNVDGQVYGMIRDSWRKVTGAIVRHITAGGSGVWGINRYSELIYRDGISEDSPFGTSWTTVPSDRTLKQIDSGPFGQVAALNFDNTLLIRNGITPKVPTGTDWIQVRRNVRSFAVGSYGIWVVDDDNSVYFGKVKIDKVTERPTVDWARVDGKLREVNAGFNGQVWGISPEGKLLKRLDVSIVNPYGTQWLEIKGISPRGISSGLTGTYVQLEDGRIIRTRDLSCGDILTTSSGVIQSPNYPSDYPNDKVCLWIIRIENVKVISVRFDDFELEKSFGCQKDKIVTFKEGYYMPYFEPLFECGDQVKDKTVEGNTFWLEFISTRDTPKRGFSLSYYGYTKPVTTSAPTSTPPSDCSKVLTGRSGRVRSPNYPSNYYDNINCIYRIQLQEGNRVQLSILDFSVENHGTCSNDWLEIYDGRSTSDLSLGRFCGNRIPKVITSSSPYLTLRFKTNGNIGDRGFEAQWESIQLGQVTTTKTPTTPQDKERLPAGWKFIPSTPTHRFVDIAVSESDNVFALDDHSAGALVFSDNNWERVGEIDPGQLSHGAFTLWALDRDGRVYYLPEEEQSNGNWRSLGDEVFKSLIVGPFPNIFALKQDGKLYKRIGVLKSNPVGNSWTLVREGVQDVGINSFSIWMVDRNGELYAAPRPESSEEALNWNLVKSVPVKEIFAGFGSAVWILGNDNKLYKRTGTSPLNVYGDNWKHMNIPFIKIDIGPKTLYGLTIDGRVAKQEGAGCGGILRPKKGSIVSPLFPRMYPDNSECLWIIKVKDSKSLSVRFTSFQLESSVGCRKDFLLMFQNGKYSINTENYILLCGRQSRNQVFNTDEVWVAFHSDAFDSNNGFRILYSSTFEDTGPTTPLEATTIAQTLSTTPSPVLRTGCGGKFKDNVGLFASPEYPSPYPNNLKCIYEISVDPRKSVELSFDDFDIEDDPLCRFDFIHIRDGESEFGKDLGKYCGNSNKGKFKSTGNKLWVFFRADGSVGKRGFRARWRAADAQGPFGTTPKTFTPGTVTQPTLPPGGTLPSGWSQIVQPDRFTMVDSGTTEIVWALHESGIPYVLESYYFTPIQGNERFSYVTAGESGVWGIASDGRLFYRVGVAPLVVDGVYWENVLDSPRLRSIDSGPNNVVVAVDSNNFLYQRDGITPNRPQGTRWIMLDRNVKRASVGSYGYWIVDKDNRPYFAPHFKPGGPQTLRKIPLDERVLDIQAGFDGSVWAIGLQNNVLRREGINALRPSGTHWKTINDLKLIKVSSGLSGVFGITPELRIVTSKDLNCGGILRSRRGSFRSPNYPFSHPSRSTCLWIIHVPEAKQIEVTFRQFKLESSEGCNKDYLLTLKDGQFPSKYDMEKNCGSEIETKRFIGPKAWIEFVSDTDGNYQGFEAEYVALTEQPTAKPKTTEKVITTKPTIFQACGGRITGREGQVAHPNYPKNYQSFMDCSYVITARKGEQIVVQFVQMALQIDEQCSKDFIEIRDGATRDDIILSKLCGESPPREIKSTGESIHVKFRSDPEINDKGFLFKWRAVRKGPEIITDQPPATTESLQACGGIETGLSGVIIHPGYPYAYKNNQDCVWKIFVTEGYRIEFSFDFFELEDSSKCQKDYVVMYDGPDESSLEMLKICGSTPVQRPRTSRNSATLRFVSDAKVNKAGFRLIWKRLAEPSTTAGPSTPKPVCEYSQTGSAGTIYHNNYPGTYRPNQDCTWTITVSRDKRIRISFDIIQLEDSPSCQKDYLNIYDGPSVTSRLDSRICGQRSGEMFLSSLNSATLQFVSDSSNEGIGFYIRWFTIDSATTAATTKATTPSTTTLPTTTRPVCEYSQTGSSGSITHKNYPGIYKPNQECIWKITVSRDKRIVLSLETVQIEDYPSCLKDYLSIYDGPSVTSRLDRRICGRRTGETFLSTSNSVTVKFVTDDYREDFGFYILWRAIDSATTVATTKATTPSTTTLPTTRPTFEGRDFCSIDVSDVPDTIVSPNFPSNYPPNRDCSLTIRGPRNSRVIVEFERFSLEPSFQCRYDSLSIKDGERSATVPARKYCSDEGPPTIISSQNAIYLRFQTDTSGAKSGFKFKWRIIAAKTTTPIVSSPQVTEEPSTGIPSHLTAPKCGERQFGQNGIIRSPRFPKRYPYAITCLWLIEVGPTSIISVNFQYFDLGRSDCSTSYVLVRDGISSDNPLLGKFCERNIPTIVESTGNFIWIEYKTKVEENGDAFVINWNAKTMTRRRDFKCGGFVTGNTGAISSPLFPSFYPHNTMCRWLVQVPKGSKVLLRFSYFDMEDTSDCQADYVKVINGDSSTGRTLAKSCGKRTPGIVSSTGNSLWIEMKSDCKVSGSGFRAAWRILRSTSPTESGRATDNNGGLLGPKITSEKPTTERTTIVTTIPTTAEPTVPPGTYPKSTGVNTDGGLILGRSGILRSPSYPKEYPPNARVTWILQGPPNGRIRLRFQAFSLEEESGCRYDYVQIRDGDSVDAEEAGRFCGARLPATYISGSNRLWVRFKSDASLGKSGFEASWEWIPDVPDAKASILPSTNTGCGGIIKQSAGSLRSPNYPNNYPNNLDCIWIIKPNFASRIQLNFYIFELEGSANCISDYLEVRKGDSSSGTFLSRQCGRRQGLRYISDRGAFWIRFKTDSSQSGIGFEAEWITTANVKIQKRRRRDTLENSKFLTCGRTFSQKSGHLVLPAREGLDSIPLFCRWIIKVPLNHEIYIKVDELNFKRQQNCDWNFFEVRVPYKKKSTLLTKYCPDMVHRRKEHIIRSRESEVEILYRSSERPTKKQFRIRWDSYRRKRYTNGISSEFTLYGSDTGCSRILTSATGSFESPNYPRKYPVRSSCVWRISIPDPNKAIKLTFDSFSLEDHSKCRYDYLLVRDGDSPQSRIIGKFCGARIPSSIRSSSSKMWIGFYSDSAFTASGFRAIYQTVDRIPENVDNTLPNPIPAKKCGGKLTGARGRFTSPNYPAKYPRKTTCVWQIINKDPSLVVQVEFENFKLEHGYLCQNDYVLFRNGLDPNQVLGKFCGSDLPRPITEVSLEIEFSSDDSHNRKGFLATWKLIPKPTSQESLIQTTRYPLQSCGGYQTGFVGFLRTTNYPENYSNNQRCKWILTSQPYTQLQLRFANFDIEYSKGCVYDYVEVYDGRNTDATLIGKYCGQEIPSLIISTHNSLCVVFSSDDADTRSGFEATWVAEMIQAGDNTVLTENHPRMALNRPVSGSCGGIRRGREGTIQSPNHPNRYSSNTNCIWDISGSPNKVIELTFKALDVEYHRECKYDRVVVRDGSLSSSPVLKRLCGNTLPKVIRSTKPQLKIQFYSDSTSEGKGFKVEWKQVDREVDQSRCGGKLSGSKGTITSPSYTKSTGERQICKWEITVPQSMKIKLTFNDLDIRSHPSCGFGYVQIHDGRDLTSNEIGLFCGSYTPKPIITSGNQALIGYLSDAAKNTRGFKLIWEATNEKGIVTPTSSKPPDTPCDAILRRETGTIAMYKAERNCTWTIKMTAGAKITLSFLTMELASGPNCDVEYLEVREGFTNTAPVLLRVCGNVLPRQLTTFAGILRVSYVSIKDTSKSNARIRLSWKSAKDGKSSDGINNDACGITKAKIETTFVDGRAEAPSGSLPWVVALSSGIGRAYCGGSLISTNWIITAAHCFERFPFPSFWDVVAGEVDLSSTNPNKQSTSVQNIFMHPSYNPVTRENDIALVQLNSQVTFNDKVNSICLADADDQVAPGTVCSTAGWGTRRFLGKPSVPLIHVRPPFVSIASCNATRAYHGRIKKNMICAGRDEGGVDSCQGDGGGPLTCKTASGKNKLYGISSWGNGCAFPFKFGVYTDTRKYIKWILSIVQS